VDLYLVPGCHGSFNIQLFNYRVLVGILLAPTLFGIAVVFTGKTIADQFTT
jgi:hypothetical protein